MRIEAVELYGQKKIEEGKIEGKIEGKMEEKIEIARNMKNKGFSKEDIIGITKISSEDLKSL